MNLKPGPYPTLLLESVSDENSSFLSLSFSFYKEADLILKHRDGSSCSSLCLPSLHFRSDTEYETILTVTGILGEKPCKLQIRGQGTYDGKYEDMYWLKQDNEGQMPR